jgi:acetyl-CoA carboxylase biotin carboxyl carrier protein
MALSNDDVQEILRILDDSPYDELELETARFRLTLRRSASGAWISESHSPGNREASGQEDIPATRSAAAAPPVPAPGIAPPPPSAPADDEDVITAPLVGTFYRAPKPGAPPFVEPGTQVEEHTVVCIIETMKLMNSVPAGSIGKITEILAEDGAFVEQGQALMRIRAERNQ